MPNWVFNNLTVSGDAVDLAKFKEEIAAPYTTYHRDLVSVSGEWAKNEDGSFKREIVESVHESDLSFWNAIAPTDIDAYFGGKDPKPANPDATVAETMAEIKRGFDEDNDWYNWNVRNWGSKWDACNAELDDRNQSKIAGFIEYTFDTAWGIPEAGMVAMSAKYPELVFHLYAKEEQGWGAEMQFVAGDVELINEWDIPASHAENIEIWGECWKCNDYPEDLYDDCPPQDLTEIEESGSVGV